MEGDWGALEITGAKAFDRLEDEIQPVKRLAFDRKVLHLLSKGAVTRAQLK